MQKLVLLDTYRKLLTHLRWEKVTMISYFGIFAVTYIIVQTVTFTECDPFNHYWIVLPDPGITFPLFFVLDLLTNAGLCCQAQLQLIVLGKPSRRSFQCNTSNTLISPGVLNVITDLMLIALPIPILIMVKRSAIE